VGKWDISDKMSWVEKEERIIPLYDLWGGIGCERFFYLGGSYREPLINLKVGPKEKELTFFGGHWGDSMIPHSASPPRVSLSFSRMALIPR
jgi:hypothetical protein